MLLQLLFVLVAIIIGARLGGIGLGVMGGVGISVLTFVFGLQPTAPPIDVMLMIAAVISAASCMQAAGGLDYMVKIAEKLTSEINGLEQDILKLQQGLNSSLERLDLELAENINNKIASEIEKLEKKRDEAIEFNNKVSEMEAEYQVERLSKIDEAQKKIEMLSTNIMSLQDILNDKKSRGTFGEVQLELLLKDSFGDNNYKIYELQKTLSNDKIVDAYYS